MGADKDRASRLGGRPVAWNGGLLAPAVAEVACQLHFRDQKAGSDGIGGAFRRPFERLGTEISFRNRFCAQTQALLCLIGTLSPIMEADKKGYFPFWGAPPCFGVGFLKETGRNTAMLGGSSKQRLALLISCRAFGFAWVCAIAGRGRVLSDQFILWV